MLGEAKARAHSLVGGIITSQARADVRYHLERLVGEGGMGSAYLAQRDSPEGASAVVVKVMNPTLGDGDVAPELVAMKEAVALGRLNESVPPTPFVVRFVDTGTAPIFGPNPTPWTAIEYVHGGVEGTTLEDRVTYSLHKTGFGFAPERVAHALACLAAGLTAIHRVGVIHRDLSPGNVLCCGFGETEIFKISDFGIARASGVKQSFVGLMLGTLGYSAPESSLDAAGPQSDVFSLAAVLYYCLTGQRYFDVDSPREAMQKFAARTRPSITDHATLIPELVDRPEACRAIDQLLARATAAQVTERPGTAGELAATLLPWLGDQHAGAHSGPHSSRKLRSAVRREQEPAPAGAARFIVKHHGSSDQLITSVAWNTDGHAFVVSQAGALFWDGQAFLDATGALGQGQRGATFVTRYDAGGWLVGGNGPTLSVIDTGRVRDQLDAQGDGTCLSLASGRFDDLLAAVATRPGAPPTLLAVCARRWLKSMPLPGVAAIATLQRLDDARWLVGGRLVEGGGFAAVYSPLLWELQPLAIPAVRAVIGGAPSVDQAPALLVGSEGLTLRFDSELAGNPSPTASSVPGAPDLSTAAVDALDREWVTSLGVLWSRDPKTGEPWRPAWAAPSLRAPFVSVMADVGLVVAMTADGTVVEGRIDGPVTLGERRE